MKIGRSVRKYICVYMRVYKVLCASLDGKVSRGDTLSLLPDFDVTFTRILCISTIYLTLLQLYAYHNIILIR